MSNDSKITTLLLADNNINDAELIRDTLNWDKYDIINAWDGEQALNYLTDNKNIDLVLLDMNISNLSAFSLLKKLSNKNVDYPIIMLTDDEKLSTVFEALKLGAHCFIPKSVGYDSLPDLIERTIENHAGKSFMQKYQKEFQSREDKYKAIIEQTNAVPFIYNLESDKFTYLGKQIESLLGYPAESWSNIKSWADKIYPADRLSTINYSKKETEKLKDHKFEYRAFTNDKEIKWIREDVKVIVKNSKAYELNGFMFDITEIKHTEEALRERESELNERVKELNCLYGISMILEETNIPVDNIFQRIVDLIPNAWLNPDNICAKLFINGIEYKTKNYNNSTWNLKKEIFVRKKNVGFMEINLLSSGKESTSTPFMKIDEKLLNAVVNQISLFTDRKVTLYEYKNSRLQLRDLAKHKESAIEKEKKRISMIVHDELGQSLTAMKFNINLLNDKIKPKKVVYSKLIDEMEEIIDLSIDKVRTISTELRPSILDHLGLIAAFEWQLNIFAKKTNIDYMFNHNVKSINIPGDKKIVIFRIFQEVLTNIGRHAEATKMDVNLIIRDNLLEMEINDNGIGIQRKQVNDPRSFGIISMRERALSINGELFISGIKNMGTTISLTMKLEDEKYD